VSFTREEKTGDGGKELARMLADRRQDEQVEGGMARERRLTVRECLRLNAK
jgi:hypothetical protein